MIAIIIDTLPQYKKNESQFIVDHLENIEMQAFGVNLSSVKPTGRLLRVVTKNLA